MKVLHLLQKSQLRGVEVFTNQLAMHLEAAGHESVLVYLFKGSADLGFTGKTYCLDGTPCLRLGDVGAWSRLAKIIAAEQPDLVQANAGDTLKYAVYSKLFFGWNQPVIFRNASTISLYIKSPLAIRWNKWLFSHTRQIISVSQSSATDFLHLFPHYHSKVVVAPIGIEERSLNATKNNVLKLEGRRKGPVLLHVGGFTHEKNHVGLLRIFDAIHAAYPEATLHLVGDGPLRQSVQKMADRFKDQVVFHGFRQDARDLMPLANVLVLPSLIEGLPAVILEAFDAGLPVVAYNVGGVGELVNRATGWLVPRGNEKSFAASVLQVLEAPEQRAFVCANAKQLVHQKYLNKAVAQQFIKSYKQVLNTAGAGEILSLPIQTSKP